jgi:ligand-binding SRPBCC domain-containing protein
MTNAPSKLTRGAQIRYALSLEGIAFGWKTLIAAWEPPNRFVDVQLHGPYALWRHEHAFTEVPGGVSIRDRVDYALPFAPLSALVAPLIERKVQAIFDYRRRRIAEHFGEEREAVAATPLAFSTERARSDAG